MLSWGIDRTVVKIQYLPGEWVVDGALKIPSAENLL
jgi:hypothetical protein